MKTNPELYSVFEDLKQAKENVLFLLETPNGNVDFHDIVYRAGIVQTLRNKIAENI